MLKKILVIIVTFAICSQSITVVASSNISGIEKTVLQVLQELSRDYSIPPNVLSTMPKQYAEEAAKYDLTSVQMSELAKRLKNILLEGGDYIAEQDLDAIAGTVEYVVFLIKRDTAIASFQFPGDKPSDSARDAIVAMILDGKIPEAFQINYQKPITVGQMAELFISQDTSKRYDKIKIVNDTITMTLLIMLR